MSGKQYHQSSLKRQALREERTKKERQKRLRLVMTIVGVAIGVVALVVALRAFASPSATDIIEITPAARPQVDRNSMGDPNAPVQIVEFSDFQCPYCGQFATTTEPLITETYVSSGKVYFTYRSMGNFISQNIGRGSTESRDSAEAAYCAADQGKFWDYRDILFANVKGEDVGSFTKDRLVAMAEALGLNSGDFRDCLDSGKYRDQVNQDYLDGREAGVTGTPSFLINGKLLVGAQPFSVFQQEIEAALAAGGN